MKTILFAALLFVSNCLMAALPCSWQSNYGYIKAITPYPFWNSVRIVLKDGQTQAASYATYNLPVPPATDLVKTEIFRQTMDLVKDANSRGAMISIETNGASCSKGVSLPEISFVTTQLWWK